MMHLDRSMRHIPLRLPTIFGHNYYQVPGMLHVPRTTATTLKKRKPRRALRPPPGSALAPPRLSRPLLSARLLPKNCQKRSALGPSLSRVTPGGLPGVQQRATTTTAATTTARASARARAGGGERRCVLGRLSDGDIRGRRRVRLEPGHDDAGREEFPLPLVPFGDVVRHPSPLFHRLLHFRFRCRFWWWWWWWWWRR